MINYFPDIRELVSPEIYAVLGEASWRLIPKSAIESLNHLRESLGFPLWVNNWCVGGEFRYSGIRPQDCPEGANLSRHKLTANHITAFDLKCSDMPRLEKLIRERFLNYRICRVENPRITPGWIHIEISDIPMIGPLVVFDP